ncbi:MAG: M50 family metallopeptidase [Candidatus Coproplasma sp.]
MSFLSASNGWRIVGSVILAILILLAMICVHEFGHYLAGRILHFKINEFSIGFGPAVFKRKGKKNGVTFSLRAVPLGGYCSFEGEDGKEENNGKDKAEQTQKAGDNVGEEDGERGKQTQNAEDSGKAEQSNPDSFNNKKPWKRIIVLLSGAFMNYILAVLLIIVGFFCFGQPCYKMGAIVESEEYSSQYSLLEGDVILKVDGKGVYFAPDLTSALNGKRQGDMVGLTLLREGKKIDAQVVLRSDCNFSNSSDTSKVWSAFGSDTYLAEDGNLYWSVSSQNVRFGFFSTLGRAFAYSFKTAGAIFQALGELITGNLSLSAMGGPVTTITLTGKIASQGLQSFLQVASYIGVNLAVFNLLPIPALDGSKVVFCLIEWVFKKPVPRKVEAVIHTVGLFLIIAFALLVDVLQFARC